MSLNPDVVFRILGDGAVLVHLSTNEIFEMNATAAAIWRLLEQGETPEAIVAELVATFDVTADAARTECAHLIATLEQRGLLLP